MRVHLRALRGLTYPDGTGSGVVKQDDTRWDVDSYYHHEGLARLTQHQVQSRLLQIPLRQVVAVLLCQLPHYGVGSLQLRVVSMQLNKAVILFTTLFLQFYTVLL